MLLAERWSARLGRAVGTLEDGGVVGVPAARSFDLKIAVYPLNGEGWSEGTKPPMRTLTPTTPPTIVLFAKAAIPPRRLK